MYTPVGKDSTQGDYASFSSNGVEFGKILCGINSSRIHISGSFEFVYKELIIEICLNGMDYIALNNQYIYIHKQEAIGTFHY